MDCPLSLGEVRESGVCENGERIKRIQHEKYKNFTALLCRKYAISPANAFLFRRFATH